MIDCHCHLVDNKFKTDIDEVINESISNGIMKAVVVPEFGNQFDKVLDLKKRYPNFVIAAMGYHPIQKNKKSVQHKDLINMESFLSSHQDLIQCIGEVGLDYTVSQFKISDNDKVIQKEVFSKQIMLAKQFNLPLNVHSRSAASETVEFLAAQQAENVVMHAFGGEANDILKGLALGYFFSIPPSYAFSDYGIRIVEIVPLEQLLLETDSPVLGPTKGVRNTPSNCVISAEFIAKVKHESISNVIEITSSNAAKLFQISNI